MLVRHQEKLIRRKTSHNPDVMFNSEFDVNSRKGRILE